MLVFGASGTKSSGTIGTYVLNIILLSFSVLIKLFNYRQCNYILIGNDNGFDLIKKLLLPSSSFLHYFIKQQHTLETHFVFIGSTHYGTLKLRPIETLSYQLKKKDSLYS